MQAYRPRGGGGGVGRFGCPPPPPPGLSKLVQHSACHENNLFISDESVHVYNYSKRVR